MYCKHCGILVTGGSNICKHCNKDIFTGKKFCPRCGTRVARSKEICNSCGGGLKLSTDPTMKSSLNNNNLSVLQGLLFYGFVILLFIAGVYFLLSLVDGDSYDKTINRMFSIRFFIFSIIFGLFSKIISIGND